MKQLLNSGDFYYSYTYDITNSLQRKEGHNPNTPLFLRVTENFIWLALLFISFSNSG